MRRSMRLALAAGAALAATAGIAIAAEITAPTTAVLPADAIPIGASMDRSWYLGGFSDLTPRGDDADEFWSITDRGPNLDGGVGGVPCAVGTKVYPLPAFAPEIVQLDVKKNGVLQVKKRIPLKFPTGPAVGTSVRPVPKNEASVDPTCAPLGTSPRGIDSEGLVVDPRDDSFWIADEYLPSILRVSRKGTVLSRIVPAGTESTVSASGVSIAAAFPATVGTNFRPNRGFEGIAISRDGRTLYTALQSPMDYRPTGTAPSGPSPRNSLALRVFRLDISSPSSPTVTGQWVYPLDKGAGNGPLADKVSALIWMGPDLIAVEERDDPANDPNDNPQNTVNTRVYIANLAAVPPIPAQSVWNGETGVATGGKSLEQWYVPGAGAGAPADLPAATPKCLYADVAALLRDAGITDPNDPSATKRAGNGKIEGVALVQGDDDERRGRDDDTEDDDKALLAVLNDNDFGLVVPIPEQLNLLEAPSACTP